MLLVVLLFCLVRCLLLICWLVGWFGYTGFGSCVVDLLRCDLVVVLFGFAVLVLVVVCVLLFVLFVVSVDYCSCFWVVWSGLVLVVGIMVPVNSVVFVISLSMFGLIDCYVLGLAGAVFVVGYCFILRVVFLVWFMLVVPVVCRLFGMWVLIVFVLFGGL